MLPKFCNSWPQRNTVLKMSAEINITQQQWCNTNKTVNNFLCHSILTESLFNIILYSGHHKYILLKITYIISLHKHFLQF